MECAGDWSWFAWKAVGGVGLLLFVSGFVMKNLIYKPKGIKNFQNKHVVITGGSAGLGKQLAIQLAKEGANISLIARDVAKLKATVKECEQNQKDSTQKFFFVSADVGIFNEIQKAMNTICDSMGVPDLVICNAGVSYPTFLVDNTPEKIEKELRLNYLGSVYSVKSVLPAMMQKKQGSFVIISSAAALAPFAGYACYSASKLALKAFVDAMRNELIPHNLEISIAFPGSIDTEGYEEEEKMKPEVTKKIEHSSTLLKPHQVATHILNGIRQGDNYIIYDFDIHIARILSHGMSPRSHPIFDMILAPFATLIGPIVSHFQFDDAVRKTQNKKIH